MKKRILEIIIGLVIALIIHSHLVILPNMADVVSHVAGAPTSTIGLVFGGGMKDVDTMSDLQEDRVIRGVELYKAGKVEKLMMTGDDGQRIIDEVHAMREYAIAQGVPEEDILLDPHGYRTYESCYRISKVYNIKEVIAVSQNFHLARIIFLCDHLGVKTKGVSADLRDYPAFWKMQLREVGARVKAYWQIEVTKPLPRSLEP